MFQVKIYDASQNFRIIPNGEKYQLSFWQNNSIRFTSKRKAFDFLSKLNNLFTEVLTLCELINNQVNTFTFQLTPSNKTIHDKYHLFTENQFTIHQLFKDFKYFRKEKTELYQIIKKFDSLFYHLHQNITILNAKLKNVCASSLLLLSAIKESFRQILSNPVLILDNPIITLFRIQSK